MRKGLMDLVVILTFFVLASAVSAQNLCYPVKVERVIDGDTIVVDVYLGLNVVLTDQYIRFYDVDTWEIKGENKARGVIAKQYVQKRIEDARIVIVEFNADWGYKGKGKYGRWLGVIWVDEENLNKELAESEHRKTTSFPLNHLLFKYLFKE